jgi:hypothetical protein
VSAFVHGEAGLVKELRRHLRIERGLPLEQLSISGYWRLGVDDDGGRASKSEWNRQNTPGRPVARLFSGGRWRVVPSAPNRNTHTGLTGVAAVDSKDAWAVGSTGHEGGKAEGPSWSAPIIEHWDGARWTNAPAVHLPKGNAGLDGVVAVNARDVWAIGWWGKGALIAHWDGTSWSVVPDARPDDHRRVLFAIAAVSATDIWALGGGPYTVIEHWDGHRWSDAAIPRINGDPGADGPHALAARATDDVWAVGTEARHPLALHWDGRAWRKVPTPIPSGLRNLNGVIARTATDAVAFGTVDPRGSAQFLRWNGLLWRPIAAPRIFDNPFMDNGSEPGPATDDGRGGIWWASQAGMVHWDGRSWATAPPARNGEPHPAALTRVPGSPVIWGVGSVGNGKGGEIAGSDPVIEVYQPAPGSP